MYTFGAELHFLIFKCNNRTLCEVEKLGFNNLLYIEEDSSDDLAEFEDKLLNPEALIFDKICDEIFADG